MRALAHLVDREDLHGPVLADVDARRLELLFEGAELAAEVVDQETHLDALPGCCDHGIRELLPGLVGLEDVRLEVHRPRSPADVPNHRGKDRVAVLEQDGRVARDEWVSQSFGRPRKGRILDRKGWVELVDVPLLRADDIVDGGATRHRAGHRDDEGQAAEIASESSAAFPVPRLRGFLVCRSHTTPLSPVAPPTGLPCRSIQELGQSRAESGRGLRKGRRDSGLTRDRNGVSPSVRRPGRVPVETESSRTGRPRTRSSRSQRCAPRGRP